MLHSKRAARLAELGPQLHRRHGLQVLQRALVRHRPHQREAVAVGEERGDGGADLRRSAAGGRGAAPRVAPAGPSARSGRAPRRWAHLQQHRRGRTAHIATAAPEDEQPRGAARALQQQGVPAGARRCAPPHDPLAAAAGALTLILPCTTGRHARMRAGARPGRTWFLASTARPLPGTGRSAVSRYSRGVSCAARRHAHGRAPLCFTVCVARSCDAGQALAHPRALAEAENALLKPGSTLTRAPSRRAASQSHWEHSREFDVPPHWLHGSSRCAQEVIVLPSLALLAQGSGGPPARLPAVLLQREVEVAEQPQERGRKVGQLRLAALACAARRAASAVRDAAIPGVASSHASVRPS